MARVLLMKTWSTTVQNSPNTLAPTGPKLEEPVSHDPTVWHPKRGPKLAEKFGQPGVVCKNTHWPGLDLFEHTPTEVLDGVGHGLG